LPKSVTFVELPVLTLLVEVLAARPFPAPINDCPSAVPPQDNATKDITDQYTLPLRILCSSKFFMIFKWFDFSKQLPRSFKVRGPPMHITVQGKVWFKEKFQAQQFARKQ
jgi:hypothetical protein